MRVQHMWSHTAHDFDEPRDADGVAERRKVSLELGNMENVHAELVGDVCHRVLST